MYLHSIVYFKPKAHGTYAWWLLYIPCEGLRSGHITSKRRVVNASLFVIVVIIVNVFSVSKTVANKSRGFSV